MKKKVLIILLSVTIMCFAMAFVSSAIVTQDEYVTKDDVYKYFTSVSNKMETDVEYIKKMCEKNKIMESIKKRMESTTTPTNTEG